MTLRPLSIFPFEIIEARTTISYQYIVMEASTINNSKDFNDLLCRVVVQYNVDTGFKESEALFSRWWSVTLILGDFWGFRYKTFFTYLV